ncbi:MAG: amidase [Sterolibacterium sp.]|jgi:Asp-tRNA(Asn)/Glu-tRNA(Gln) amidotransferase A subunit family amidase
MLFEKLDAVATAEIVRSGALPPSFAVESALARLSQRNPALNAVIDRFDDHARSRVEAGVPMGLLAGVPFLLKDTVEYPGFRHTEGSRWFAQRIGRAMPPWVAAMRDQGAIFIGKTNTPEFGLMDVTEPVAHGATLNPWNPAVTVGGSSGGSAAAVAAGIVPIAHGTDGGGSIRFPAACCGLFGFKPSHDLTPVPFASFDPRIPGGAVRHVLTRSVRDSALAFAIAAAAHAGEPGSELRRWVREPLSRRLRIAVIDVPTHGGPLAANHRAALDDARTLLESLGHTLTSERWPFDGPRQHKAFFGRWAYGTYRFTLALPDHERRNFLDAVEPFTRGLIEQGEKFSADEAEALVQDAIAVKAAMDGFYQAYDALLTPISAVHPLPLGHHDPRQDYASVLERVSQNVAFTHVQNIAGQPAMSVPLFWTEDSLPLGIQLAAAAGQDDLLLRLAYELEYARPWQQRWPPLAARQEP